MLVQYINNIISKIGIEIHRPQTLVRQIQQGKFGWLQEREIKTIIDIGANIGEFSELMRKISPSAMIYSFEPLESCFKILEGKIDSLKPIKCYPFGLGEENSTLIIHHNEHAPSSSLLPMTKAHRDAFPYTNKSIEERIEVKILDDVMSETPVQGPVLMKIDVQGYELNVLRGSENVLQLVDILIIEVSFTKLYEGQPLFDDIYEYLKKRKFTYAGNMDQLKIPKNGTVLQADAIFINTAKILTKELDK